MSVSPGTRLGPYEIVAPIGAGGMGEVYKARDLRLERSVAIKILPAEFAGDAQLKVRFEREARTISQLTHPHICTLYDVGSDGGVEYLVMELLEGETLADRIAKGPLPIEQVMRIGADVAEALHEAHRAGVVHRDLKPGNVMLTRNGAKLLDFGLAKPAAVLGPPPAGSTTLAGATVAKPLTREGTIVGTFQYMAPEQVEGRDADARTDVFALGAVLYEMATGRRAFEGASKASLIASILDREPPPIRAVQPLTPPAFEHVVARCLKKDPDERWQSAKDIAAELRWAAESPAVAAAAPRRRSILWPAAAALLAVAAATLGALFWRERIAHDDAPVIRTSILPPENAVFSFLAAGAPPAISRDGRRIVFGAAETGKPRTLWVRSLDSPVARPLAGTEGASYPFWSPDGRTVAFFSESALKKIDIVSGAVLTICDVVDRRGGSWSADGRTIIFGSRYSPVFRVSSSGGEPVAVTKLDEHAVTHRWPEFLPDSRHFLFLASPSGSDSPDNTICLGGIDGAPSRPLIRNAEEPHAAGDWIVFVRDRKLMAQRFDMSRLELSGDPQLLDEGTIGTAPVFSRSMLAIAGGTMVYQPGAPVQLTTLTWFNRKGAAVGTVGEPGQWASVALSPDAKRVLVSSVFAPPRNNLWMFDLARGGRSRVTFGTSNDTGPLWAPDGSRFVYSSTTAGRFRIVLHDLRNGAEQQLMDGPMLGGRTATSFSPDGRYLLLTISGHTTGGDIWLLPLEDRKPRLLAGTAAIEANGRFSPDGKWIAYQSNESGANQVYIAPFPSTGAKWQVSIENGVMPRWRADGKELFFTSNPAAPRMMSVALTLGATPEIGTPQPLFPLRVGTIGAGGLYDVAPDGQRFLINFPTGEEPVPPPLVLVQNFDAELHAAERRE